MKKVLFVDFENFRKNAEAVFISKGKDKPLWHTYDFNGLFERVLNGTTIDEVIFYYAKIISYEETKEKSEKLIKERRLLKKSLENKGFRIVIAGRVRGFQETNTFLGFSNKLVFKEKGVDVKIAIDMVVSIIDKSADTIILGSSDSDLQPAIDEVKKRGGRCVYLGFESSSNKGMAYNCGRAILIRDSEVLEFAKNSLF